MESQKEALYQWMKRYENYWSWITLSVDVENNKIHFYLNGNESDARHGHGTHSPLSFDGKLKRYGSVPFTFRIYNFSWRKEMLVDSLEVI